MKKSILLCLSVLISFALVFSFVSCDSDPYISGQATSAGAIKDAIDSGSESVMIKAGSYHFDDNLVITNPKSTTLYVDGGKATLDFAEGKGIVVSDKVADGDVVLKNLDINGSLTVNGGGSNSIHLENTTVVSVTMDKEVKEDSQIPRLVLEGNSKVETLTVSKKSYIEAPKKVIVNAVINEETIVIGEDTNIFDNEPTIENGASLQPGVAQISNDYYGTFEEAFKAAVDGDVITLLSDASVGSAEAPLTTNFIIGKNLDINLNEKTLSFWFDSADYNESRSVKVMSDLTISNGNLLIDSGKCYWYPVIGAIFVSNAEFTLDNVVYTTPNTAIMPGQDSIINVVSSTINSGAIYGISTNNVSSGVGITLNITDSTVKTSGELYENEGGFAVLLNTNTSSTATIKNSTLSGTRGCLAVRGYGDVTLEDVTLDYLATDSFYSGWSSGNGVPASAITIGNNSDGAYKCDSNVVIKGNTTIVVPAESAGNYIYMMGRPTYTASLDTTGATNLDTVVTIGNAENVTINGTDVKEAGKVSIVDGKAVLNVTATSEEIFSAMSAYLNAVKTSNDLPYAGDTPVIKSFAEWFPDSNASAFIEVGILSAPAENISMLGKEYASDATPAAISIDRNNFVQDKYFYVENDKLYVNIGTLFVNMACSDFDFKVNGIVIDAVNDVRNGLKDNIEDISSQMLADGINRNAACKDVKVENGVLKATVSQDTLNTQLNTEKGVLNTPVRINWTFDGIKATDFVVIYNPDSATYSFDAPATDSGKYGFAYGSYAYGWVPSKTSIDDYSDISVKKEYYLLNNENKVIKTCKYTLQVTVEK